MPEEKNDNNIDVSKNEMDTNNISGMVGNVSKNEKNIENIRNASGKQDEMNKETTSQVKAIASDREIMDSADRAYSSIMDFKKVERGNKLYHIPKK